MHVNSHTLLFIGCIPYSCYMLYEYIIRTSCGFCCHRQESRTSMVDYTNIQSVRKFSLVYRPNFTFFSYTKYWTPQVSKSKNEEERIISYHIIHYAQTISCTKRFGKTRHCKFEICTEETTIQSETYPTQRPLNIKRYTTANSTVNYLQRPKCHQVRLQQTSNPQPTCFSLYVFSICFLLPYMLIQALMLIPTYPSCPIYILPHRHRQFLCASAPENYLHPLLKTDTNPHSPKSGPIQLPLYTHP